VPPIKSPTSITPDTAIRLAGLDRSPWLRGSFHGPLVKGLFRPLGETRLHVGEDSPDFSGHGFENGLNRMAEDQFKYPDIGKPFVLSSGADPVDKGCEVVFKYIHTDRIARQPVRASNRNLLQNIVVENENLHVGAVRVGFYSSDDFDADTG